MYGLPDDVDLSFLRGAVLQQACFGVNELILRFDDATTITIESAFTIAAPGHPEERFDDVRPSAQRVVALIDRRIEAAEALAGGTLSLRFTGGHRLDVHDSSAEFESYQIARPDHVIVV